MRGIEERAATQARVDADELTARRRENPLERIADALEEIARLLNEGAVSVEVRGSVGTYKEE